MPLPLFKLGALLAKQISKPLSKILKDKAKQNEAFRTYVVIPSANLYHTIDITLRMRVLGLGSPDKVPPMTEKAAIELGGDILSEFFVFGTAAALILIEYLRQSSNKSSKDMALSQKVQDLEVYNEELKGSLKAMNQRLGEISKFIQEQKLKAEEMNGRISKLEVKKGFKTQAVQTTVGRQFGRIIIPTKLEVKASQDVTNSIMYQCAEQAVIEMRG